MGKHNGKARRNGLSVGSALVNRAKRDGRTNAAAAHLHTTDAASGGNALQSVIETNDLQEMMSMAELAERDFAAERYNIVVVSTGPPTAFEAQRAAAERAEAEARHAHRLRIPRRPDWTSSMSPDQLDAQERASFLEWRRDLAALEGDERLVLTPFEKNLEVWRQLWRVVERSDIVVQVVDARDPLTYRSEDLEAYCQELHATKRSLVLLNKADLLPEPLRRAWADYFDDLGLKYAFWSAKAASEAQEEAQRAAQYNIEPDGIDVPRHVDRQHGRNKQQEDPRARLLTIEELMTLLKEEAAAAATEAETQGLERTSRGDRYVVGLTGYPNVGKSSTINALFGSKKTAVAATPGKTKHFQTLNVSDELCICDCPGLVMPQFAHSKAEMVAAGVIPIDRLTDVRAPVAAVAARVSRSQLERVYGIRLPSPAAGEHPDRPPTAPEVLRALALSRGWVGASGLPDETRAGRRMLKDFVDGRILACNPPPNASEDIIALTETIAGRRYVLKRSADGRGSAVAKVDEDARSDASTPRTSSTEEEDIRHATTVANASDASASGPAAVAPPLSGRKEGPAIVLDDADLELFESVHVSDTKAKPVRAAHKFHKKAPRTKGRNQVPGGGGGQPGGVTAHVAEVYDGAPLGFGKRGGLVRIASSGG
jgi:large subunit GTPase 1